MEIADRIKKARKAANMTQKDLADKLGVSYVVISQYENGNRNPKIEQLQKIADALNVTVDVLLGNTSEPLIPSADMISWQKKYDGFFKKHGTTTGNFEKLINSYHGFLDSNEINHDEFITMYNEYNRLGTEYMLIRFKKEGE